MEIISERGKKKLDHAGYIYVFDKMSRDMKLKFWRCERRTGCKGRLHEILTSGELSEVGVHNHDPNPGFVAGQKVITSAKKRALETMEPACTILSQVTQTLPEATQGCLPRIETLKRSIRRRRQVTDLAVPQTPASLAQLVIPSQYQLYSSSPGVTEQFLLYDSELSTCRILIFGRRSVLNRLSTSRYWFGDGTFSITPPLFYQVYVLLFEAAGGVHPALYALLPNKQTETYVKLFTAVKNLVPQAEPEYFSTDYELAVINAFLATFPQTEIAGCLFHLMQNIKKKVANCGLLTAFKNEPEITLQVRMVGALAFVPPDYVSAAFEQLQETLDARLDPLVEYFEDNYIGRLSRRGRKIPPFPISWWNVYDRTLEGAHRSNNYSEAAHRRLHYEMNVTHPSIWKFISALCRIQKGRDIYFDELNRGDGPPRKRTKYMRLDERLLNKVSSFDDTTPHIHLDYLRGVAFNLMSD